MKEEKRSRGRPSAYKPEFAEQLISHMEKGFSFESFAATIGVHRDTLYEWAKVHSEFSDAKKIGTDLSLFHYEKLFQIGILGKVKNFNAGALIFLMKNRFKWSDQQEVKHTGEMSLHAQLVQAIKKRKEESEE